MLDNLNLTDPVALIIAIVIVLFLGFGIYDGYKKGFLESGIRLIGYILLFVGSYILKNPLSVFLYTHLPFFKFKGLFEGVSALNILIYELIAFVLIFIGLLVIFKIICTITRLVERLLSLILFIGLPNKILGAILGFVQNLVILYFVIAVFKIGSGVFGYDMKDSLADYVLDIPVLNNVFGSSISSFEDIASLAKDYEHTNDKEEFNKEAINILLDYEIITEDNLELLIDSGKIDISLDNEE